MRNIYLGFTSIPNKEPLSTFIAGSIHSLCYVRGFIVHGKGGEHYCELLT